MIYKSKVFTNKTKLKRLLRLAKTKKYSAPELAKIFNCNKKSIFKALKQNSITLPNLGRFEKRVYCNTEFFRKLNPISAYWAGFIAADGVLVHKGKSVSISLNKKDANHLHKFKNEIQTNAKIGYIKSNNSVRIGICSKELFNSLVKLGITPNKSLTISRVNIPSYLMPHFIRGVFDGDGSVSGKKLSHVQLMIAGNKPFLEQIQETFVKECNVNKVKIYPLKSKAFRLQYTGTQIFRILNFIYKDSTETTRLERKYKKMAFLKEKFGLFIEDYLKGYQLHNTYRKLKEVEHLREKMVK